ncbi:hypothetical protein BFW01_g9079 [Lasiodiplodia theobromae]|nr:hypothetical protein BFW01_g9079 [Lasiodiplodia theobromae]
MNSPPDGSADHEVSQSLTTYVLKYLNREAYAEDVHIHTNRGPCLEETLIYADTYDTGCFQNENAGQAEILHVHLRPRKRARTPTPTVASIPTSTTAPAAPITASTVAPALVSIPASSPSGGTRFSMDDLTAEAARRITNWKDGRLVVGRVKATGAAVYAYLCCNGAVKYYATERNLNGEHMDAKGVLVMYNKVELFPETNQLEIREKLMSKRKAIEERCKRAVRAKGTSYKTTHRPKRRLMASTAPMVRREASV